MAIQDSALPMDIAWELIATSDDMLSGHKKRFPHAMWKSSMAVFSYDPDPATDLPDELIAQNREITYLKVVCTVTSYVPPCEECPPPPDPVKTNEDYGENAANLAAWRQQCQIINNMEHKVYACSGALVQIAIYPKKEANETTDPNKLAYFASFEPKKRELIEAGTESGESMTQSKSDLNVRKGTTATNSTDNYDLLTGVNVGGGFAGASAQVGVQGSWGTVKKSGSESVNITNSDSSRDLREGSSHTTNISHLYHLLNSYHLGTNRAIFFLQPRPHTLQQKDQFTFIDGPQEIEGIQEFFLVVSRPKGVPLKDYCIDALLYTAHLDDDACTKALNDPKTAETQWIEFSAIAPKIDDGGHSILNITADIKYVTDYVTKQTENLLNIWNSNADPADTPPAKHPPAICDGYITPSFINFPYNNQYIGLLAPADFTTEVYSEYSTPTSNSGWKIDRSRGLGGYDLWEDPNNKSGIPTSDDASKVPPEAFVDVISLNPPDDLDHYLPDYGLRVRALAWPSTADIMMYHGRIKAYFIRNDMATSQRAVDMFVTVRGVSTCSGSPFFNRAPDKAVLSIPDIAAENHISPRNVSPWKSSTPSDKPAPLTAVPDPSDSSKQILLSNPKGNSVPSGLDHNVLGAARSKMANMIGKQVVHSMNTSLSCLAQRTDGTLIDTYNFRATDLFFNQVSAKIVDVELTKLSANITHEVSLAGAVAGHYRSSELSLRIPSISVIKAKFSAHVLQAGKKVSKSAGKPNRQALVELNKQAKAAANEVKSEHLHVFKMNEAYPVLTLANKQIPDNARAAIRKAGFHTIFDMIGLPATDLAQMLNTSETTIRKLRLQVLGIYQAPKSDG